MVKRMKVRIHFPKGYKDFKTFEILFENVREADRFTTAIMQAWEKGFSQVDPLDDSKVFVFVKNYEGKLDETKMLKETAKA